MKNTGKGSRALEDKEGESGQLSNAIANGKEN